MSCIDTSSLAKTSLAFQGAGAVGGLVSGFGQAGADKFNAQVAAENAQIAKQNAVWSVQAGEAGASAQEQKTRATVGAVKAGQAASNIEVNTGSAPEVRTSAETLGALDALTIRSNAAREAYGQQVQATGFENQSQLDTMAASNAELSGFTTFLGGVGSAASNWANFKRLGLMTAPGSYSGVGAPISGGTGRSGYGGVM